MKEEIILYWIAVSLYGFGSIFAIIGFVFKKERFTTIALILCAIGLVPHGASILIRWIRIGHGPYINVYEVISSNTWVAMLFYLLVQKKLSLLKQASFVVLPVIFLACGFGLMASARDIPLPPSLRSYWLVLHVLFAKLTVGSFLIAFASAVLYLYKNDAKHKPLLPNQSLDKLDIAIYRFNALGFAFCIIMIIAGSIWANNAWGRYWGFDPVETWSLVVWLAYGLFLHLRLNRNWVGRRSAILTITLFLLSIGAFFFIPYLFKTIHSEYLVR